MMSYTWNQLLSYKTQIGRHNLDVMAGHEFYNYNMRYIVAERTGFPSPTTTIWAWVRRSPKANSASDNYSINSYLCRVNYDFSDRYYLSASFRMDACRVSRRRTAGEPSGRWGLRGASRRRNSERRELDRQHHAQSQLRRAGQRQPRLLLRLAVALRHELSERQPVGCGDQLDREPGRDVGRRTAT